jgi:hypothetical protein
MDKVEKIIDVTTTNEYVIGQRMELMSHAYVTLMNVSSPRETIEALGTIMSLSKELSGLIGRILHEWECPPGLIRPGNHFTEANLDNIWNSCHHFYNRFLHAPNKEQKIKELSRLYFLLLDVSEVAMVTKTERYTTGVKKVKSVIAEGY